ncbi:hypothetical protein BH24ACT5_BH24ACT5_13820 [soil metagenome]
MAVEPGQVVDQYRIDATIHRGRATTVFAATDQGLGRKVAFKVLVEDYASDLQVRERFITEAQTAASLDGHPHIVTVYKWGQTDDSMYFVTEFIDGISLAELLERQPGVQGLQPAEALGLLAQVADAIDFAHKRGAIHQDVKPANIMVKMTETPKAAYLVDFGITKVGDGNRSSPLGAFVGTPDYASPEQISGSSELDRRSDVYSLACTAFEALTGRPPFGDAPDDSARMAAHVQKPPPPAAALRSDLPRGVDAVFAKALAKRREDRFASCSEFVRALRAVFPASALEYRRPLDPHADRPPPSLYGPQQSTPRKWPWIVGGAAVGLVAVALGYALTGDMRDPSFEGTVAPDALTTTTTTTLPPTTTTTTTLAPTTTAAPTTLATPTNAYGDVVGQPITNVGIPEAVFAQGLQARAAGSTLAPAGSPAMLYAQWVRTVAAPATGPVTAADEGYAVMTDVSAVLSDFVVVDGQVTTLRECAEGFGCESLTDGVILTPECSSNDSACTTVRSRGGSVTAVKRADIALRFPARSALYELDTNRTITSLTNSDGRVRFDPETNLFVVSFADTPIAGTRDLITITFDNGDTDELIITYG